MNITLLAAAFCSHHPCVFSLSIGSAAHFIYFLCFNIMKKWLFVTLLTIWPKILHKGRIFWKYLPDHPRLRRPHGNGSPKMRTKQHCITVVRETTLCTIISYLSFFSPGFSYLPRCCRDQRQWEAYSIYLEGREDPKMTRLKNSWAYPIRGTGRQVGV